MLLWGEYRRAVSREEERKSPRWFVVKVSSLLGPCLRVNQLTVSTQGPQFSVSFLNT